MKRIEVVGAVIRKGNLVLVTQRGQGEFKDGWEFPGGKIEPGETPEEAVRREIEEELGASIAVENFLTSVEWDYPAFRVSMRLYLCRLEDPHLELREHESARWVGEDELDRLAFLPADRLALAEVKAAL